MNNLFRETIYFALSRKRDLLAIFAPFIIIIAGFSVSLQYTALFNESADFLFLAIYMLARPYFLCQLIRYMQHTVAGTTPNLSVSVSNWFRMLLVNVLFGLAAGLGFMALIIPGIYLAARYSFAEFETTINQHGSIKSMSESWTLTHNKVWVIVKGSLAFGGIAILTNMLISYVGTFNLALEVTSALMLEIVSTVSMILIAIYNFRVYTLSTQSATDTKMQSDD